MVGEVVGVTHSIKLGMYGSWSYIVSHTHYRYVYNCTGSAFSVYLLESSSQNSTLMHLPKLFLLVAFYYIIHCRG